MPSFKTRRGYGPEVGRRVVPLRPLSDRAGAIQARGTQAVASGLNQLAGGLDAVDNQLALEKEREDGFRVNQAMLDAENDYLVKFDEAKKAAPLGAEGFTEQQMAEIGQANADLIADLEAKKLSPRAIRAAKQGFGQIQQNYLRKSINFENQSKSAEFEDLMVEAGDKLANLVLANPDDLPGVEERAKALVDGYKAGTVNELQREDIENRLIEHMRKIAAIALAKQNPQRVVDAFKGNNSSNVIGAILTNSEIGLKDYMVAGIVGNLHAESKFRTGAIGDGGTAFGIAQWRKERVADLKKFAAANKADWKDLNVQSHFILWELQNSPHAKGALKALLASGNVREATAAVAKYYEKPRGSQSGDGSGSHNFKGRLNAAQRFLAGEELRGGSSSAGADDPVLGRIPAADRLAALRKAEAELNSRMSSYRTELNSDLANELAAVGEGQPWSGGERTREDFLPAFKDASVADRAYNEYRFKREAAEVKGQFHDANNGEILRQVGALGSSLDPNSPSYATDLAAFKATERAANQVFTERQDGAAYLQKHSTAVQRALASGDPQKYFDALDRAYAQYGFREDEWTPFTDSQADGFIAKYKDSPVELYKAIQEWAPGMSEDQLDRALEQIDAKGQGVPATAAGMKAETNDEVRRAHIDNAVQGWQDFQQDKATVRKQADFQRAFAAYVGQDTLAALTGDARSSLYRLSLGHYLYNNGSLEAVGGTFQQSINWMLGGTADESPLADANGNRKTIMPIDVNAELWESYWDSMRVPGEDVASLWTRNGNGAPITADGEPLTSDDIYRRGALIRVNKDTYALHFDDGPAVVQREDGLRDNYLIGIDRDAVMANLTPHLVTFDDDPGFVKGHFGRFVPRETSLSDTPTVEFFNSLEGSSTQFTLEDELEPGEIDFEKMRSIMETVRNPPERAQATPGHLEDLLGAGQITDTLTETPEEQIRKLKAGQQQLQDLEQSTAEPSTAERIRALKKKLADETRKIEESRKRIRGEE